MTQEEMEQLYLLMLKAEQVLPGNQYYKVNLLTNGYSLVGVSLGSGDTEIIEVLNPDGTVAKSND